MIVTGDLGKAIKPVGMTPLNGGVIPVTRTPVSGEYRSLSGRVFVLLLLLFLESSVWSVDPTRHISQYAHTAWRVQDGVFGGAPMAVTQTTDGYLWIGPACCASMGFDLFLGLHQMERIRRPLISLLFWPHAMAVCGSGWKVV